MKKIIASVLSAVMLVGSLSGCSFLGGDSGAVSSSSNKPKPEPTYQLEVTPTVYETDKIVTAEQTQAGSFDAWLAQSQSREAMENSIIKSPFHTLTVNGEEVPVYTARTLRGAHSFAWIDGEKTRKDWYIDVELTTKEAYGKCVALPESTGVDVSVEENTYTCKLTEFDTYTFTFAKEANAKVTKHDLAPLTLMVTEEKPFNLPDEYEEVVIEAGVHGDSELKFTEEYKAYVVKEGYHEIASISLPSNSLLYIEQGAYLDVRSGNTDAVLGSQGTYNVQIISRGLIDCGKMISESGKHPFWMARVEDFYAEGLTIINSNTWTVALYDCTRAELERNLLLGFRMFSDGIMMSDCVDSAGRYNFVRTGDDGIEFKATGWGSGTNIGSNCIYEDNDCWSDRVSAYGLIWENARDISGVTFKNNSVGFAEGCDVYRCPLEIRLGVNSKTKWEDIVYENIEVYYAETQMVVCVRVHVTDDGAARGMGGIVNNLTYKNITVNAVEDGCVAFALGFTDEAQGAITNVTIENYNFCGKVLKESDKNNEAYFWNRAVGDLFEKELTVK